MEYTNLVTASRIEENDYLENVSENEEVDEEDETSEDIITTVNGTTKPLLDKNNWQFENKSEDVIRDSYRDNWATPFYNIRHTKLQTEKKLMNKSYERLLESTKHVTVGKHTRVMQSFQTTKKILNSNSCQKKGTRRFQFLSICEEIPMPFFISDGQNNPQIKKEDFNMALEKIESKNQIKEDKSPETKKIRMAISSEDFIQNVFIEKLF